MFRTEKSKISAFNKSNEKNVFDKFDVIIKIHRFIGITYYGYYEKESKIKQIFFSFYNLIMYSIVLFISSPCLLSYYNCDQSEITKYYNKDIGVNHIMIYLILRDSIGIASSLVYSMRGQQFRELINELRNLFIGLNGKNKSFKALYLLTIIYYLISSITIIGFIIGHKRYDPNKNFLSILEIIGHFYICLSFLSTEYFIGFFTIYLVVIQKLYAKYLLNCSKNCLDINVIKEIKSKFSRIQTLIEKISKITSPLLLFNFGAIFYSIVQCFYFTVKSIWNPELRFGETYLAQNFGFIFYTIRLVFSCYCSEQLKNQVFND
jgi:hypothetical protein